MREPSGHRLLTPYQWVSLGVALRDLLGGGALLGGAVAVVAHVLGPQLQQGLAVVLQGRRAPGVRVVHPLGGVLPGCTLPIQLGKHTSESFVRLKTVFSITFIKHYLDINTGSITESITVY